MASDWNTYVRDVTFEVGEDTFVIPIWNMRVTASPYSRETGDGTHVRAFDGRFYQRHQGWRTRIAFDWSEMTPASQQVLFDLITAIQSAGVATAVLNSDASSFRVDVVMEEITDALVAQFDRNARLRPSSLSLVSVNISTVAPTWITQPAPNPFAVMYVAGNDNQPGNTKVYIAKCDRDESNLGSWNYTYLEFTKSVYGSFNKGGFFVDANAGFIFAYMTIGAPFTTGHAIRKFDLDGVYLGDVYETGESQGIDSVAINKQDQEIYISLTGPGTSRILAYDYEGNFLRIVIAQSDAATAKWMRYIAYDEGWVYYLRKNTSAFDDRQLKRADRLGLIGEQVLGASHATGDTGTGPARASLSSGYYFHDNNADGLRSIPIPVAGSISTVDNDAHNNALDVDWSAAKIYIPASSRTVRRFDFTGGNEQSIVTFPSGLNNLNSIQGIALEL